MNKPYGLEPRGASPTHVARGSLVHWRAQFALKDPQLNLDENGSACVARDCGIHVVCGSLGRPNLLLLSIFQHDGPNSYDRPNDGTDLLLQARAVRAICSVGVFSSSLPDGAGLPTTRGYSCLSSRGAACCCAANGTRQPAACSSNGSFRVGAATTPAADTTSAAAAAYSDPYGFLSWLNATRAAYGLPAVGHDPNLSSWAAENNNHQAARGMGHFVMGPARRQNAAFGSYGNIGAMWMNSPAHRAALLDPTIRWMGIAGLGAYWTFNAY